MQSQNRVFIITKLFIASIHSGKTKTLIFEVFEVWLLTNVIGL